MKGGKPERIMEVLRDLITITFVILGFIYLYKLFCLWLGKRYSHYEPEPKIIKMPKILVVEKPVFLSADEPKKMDSLTLVRPEQKPMAVKRRKRIELTSTEIRERNVWQRDCELEDILCNKLHGLSVREREVYHFLRDCNGCQAKDLAKSMNVATVTIRKCLSVLVKHNLVVKIGARKNGKYIAVERLASDANNV